MVMVQVAGVASGGGDDFDYGDGAVAAVEVVLVFGDAAAGDGPGGLFIVGACIPTGAEVDGGFAGGGLFDAHALGAVGEGGGGLFRSVGIVRLKDFGVQQAVGGIAIADLARAGTFRSRQLVLLSIISVIQLSARMQRA